MSYGRENISENTMLELNLGIAAFDRQDYDEALRLLMPIAHQGNAEAQTIIGNLYHLGLGVKQNLDEAATWYHHASRQGYGLASSNLAGIELQKGNRVEAERLFNLARQQGFEHAPISANYL